MRLSILLTALILTGCAAPRIGEEREEPQLTKTNGKYYLDDGPPVRDEVDWRTVSDAVVVHEPIDSRRNRSYEVFGVRYTPRTEQTPYRERGLASWYGRRYHGRRTSSGEVYDMYAMTSAHKTLPIPSFARVTRTSDNRSVVVRINDRGPFLPGRLLDLSYVAASKLGIVEEGVGEVIVESILPPGLANTPVFIQERLDPPDTERFVSPQSEAVKQYPADQEVVPYTVEYQDALAAQFPDEDGSAQLVSNERVDDAGPQALPNSGTYLQIGAFSQLENARRLVRSVRLPVKMAVSEARIWISGELHRVLLGPYGSGAEAHADLEKINAAGMEALIRVLP